MQRSLDEQTCGRVSRTRRVLVSSDRFFLCREIDRNLDELTGLKHEKFEIEKRLRRLKFEKYNSSNSNNVKKMAALIREKDLNSSDNESPDESDTGESSRFFNQAIECVASFRIHAERWGTLCE